MEQKNYRVLLTQKQYVKLLLADLVSRFGDSLDAIAYSWIMYEITGSESLMAFILGLNYVPTVLLQPFAGALVDRINKKVLMVVTDILRFVIVASLVILYSNHLLTPWIIAILTLFTSTVEAFRLPAGNAVTPLLLDQEYYTIAKAANYSLSRVSQLGGYILSGALISLIGSVGVLWIDAATFAISAFAISTIKLSEKKGKERISSRQVFQDFKEGIVFLKNSQIVRVVSMIGLVINFGLMPLTVFQTPYVSDYLHMGPEVLSYIKILMIIGMMVGAAITPKLLKVPKSYLCTIAGIGMGLAIACMYITATVETTTAKMILLTLSMTSVGIGGGILNVVIGSSMMAAVPKEIMGRISALNGAIMGASMPVGSFLCSLLVLKLNVIQLFLLFGVLTIIFYSYLALCHKINSIDTASSST